MNVQTCRCSSTRVIDVGIGILVINNWLVSHYWRNQKYLVEKINIRVVYSKKERRYIYVLAVSSVFFKSFCHLKFHLSFYIFQSSVLVIGNIDGRGLELFMKLHERNIVTEDIHDKKDSSNKL